MKLLLIRYPITDMALATTAMAVFCSVGNHCRWPKARDTPMIPDNIATGVSIIFPARTWRRFPLVRASEPQREEVNSSTIDTGSAFASQEDLIFLIKLGAGSVVGAAVIKYGSVVFPEITRPNILQALIMISSPVILAVFLLIKQSLRSSRDEN